MALMKIESKMTNQTTKSAILPAPDDFKSYLQSHRLIPFTLKLKADTITPVSVFQRMRLDSPCFLLESVEGSEKQARYSIIGRDPFISCQAKGNDISITIEGKNQTSSFSADPIAAIRELLEMFKVPATLPAGSFRCGLTGYFSYDFVRYIEDIPDLNPDETKLPDCDLFAPRQVIVYDHLRHEMTLVHNLLIPDDNQLVDVNKLYDQAVEALIAMKESLSRTAEAPSSERINVSDFTSNMSKESYMAAVDKTKKYIETGDIFQAVISQRFSADFQGDAFQVYRSLRNVSPSPYLFYFQLDNACLAGASPEMLVRLNDSLVETSPIAGTRKRGLNPAEDIKLSVELLADDKEMAEHAMLTDLARNDIGRISSFGSVDVTDFATVEMYSHVMHIVSKVQGKLAVDKSAVDVLCSLLPAGTLSGAPKVRAMEIIDELETTRRGPYGGAAGYLSFDGSINTCITIRTAIITDDKLHLQAGAGIVVDSNPESEYIECLNKAAAMISAIEQAGDFL